MLLFPVSKVNHKIILNIVGGFTQQEEVIKILDLVCQVAANGLQGILDTIHSSSL